MAAQLEHFEGISGAPGAEQKPLEFTITKEDIERIKQTPTSQLRDFGFSNADDLLDSIGMKQVGSERYLAKINPIKPILPGGKGGDKHPGGDTPGNPGGDWLPDPEDILDLSDEAKEALKTALAVAFVIGVVGICVSNPALLPAAARALSVLGPALAPRAMQFAR
ncbi:MAG: hypothetical protein C0507_18930 [Cyanobacteria bacterium PR.3.49]|nr:hypothetical protein [Cyanobacteria bacterium PR.3.49]